MGATYLLSESLDSHTTLEEEGRRDRIEGEEGGGGGRREEGGGRRVKGCGEAQSGGTWGAGAVREAESRVGRGG